MNGSLWYGQTLRVSSMFEYEMEQARAAQIVDVAPSKTSVAPTAFAQMPRSVHFSAMSMPNPSVAVAQITQIHPMHAMQPTQPTVMRVSPRTVSPPTPHPFYVPAPVVAHNISPPTHHPFYTAHISPVPPPNAAAPTVPGEQRGFVRSVPDSEDTAHSVDAQQIQNVAVH